MSPNFDNLKDFNCPKDGLFLSRKTRKMQKSWLYFTIIQYHAGTMSMLVGDQSWKVYKKDKKVQESLGTLSNVCPKVISATLQHFVRNTLWWWSGSCFTFIARSFWHPCGHSVEERQGKDLLLQYSISLSHNTWVRANLWLNVHVNSKPMPPPG